MLEQQNLGKVCPHSGTCPVYQGELIIERISPFLIKNVFCNRGYKGWNNCERFKLTIAGHEDAATATPYKIK